MAVVTKEEYASLKSVSGGVKGNIIMMTVKHIYGIDGVKINEMGNLILKNNGLYFDITFGNKHYWRLEEFENVFVENNYIIFDFTKNEYVVFSGKNRAVAKLLLSFIALTKVNSYPHETILNNVSIKHKVNISRGKINYNLESSGVKNYSKNQNVPKRTGKKSKTVIVIIAIIMIIGMIGSAGSEDNKDTVSKGFLSEDTTESFEPTAEQTSSPKLTQKEIFVNNLSKSEYISKKTAQKVYGILRKELKFKKIEYANSKPKTPSGVFFNTKNERQVQNMYNVSEEFKQLIKSEDRKLSFYGELTVKKGDVYELTFDDLLTLKYQANSTDEKKFEFGYVAACGLSLALNNLDGRWNDARLKGGTLKACMGLELADGTIESVPLGIFKISKVEKVQGAMMVVSMDDMMRFDRIWNMDWDIKFPISVTNLLKHICFNVNVKYAENNPTCDFIIPNNSKFKGANVRKILSLCAELMGCYAVVNRVGELELRKFTADQQAVDRILYEDLADLILDEEEITITGAGVTVKNARKEKSLPIYGEEKYIIDLSKDNALLKTKGINGDMIQTLVEGIAEGIGGLTYIPGKFSVVGGNPALEVGDIVEVLDKEGTMHRMITSYLEFNGNFAMDIVSGGETREEKEQAYAGDSGNMNNDLNNDIDEIIGLPPMSGYNGATLKTNGSEAYWSMADNTVVTLPATQDNILQIDATQHNRIFYVPYTSGDYTVRILNTNSLPSDAVVDIILVFPLSDTSVNLTWDSTVALNNPDIKNTLSDYHNEYILRIYRSASAKWFLTRQVFQ